MEKHGPTRRNEGWTTVGTDERTQERAKGVLCTTLVLCTACGRVRTSRTSTDVRHAHHSAPHSRTHNGARVRRTPRLLPHAQSHFSVKYWTVVWSFLVCVTWRFSPAVARRLFVNLCRLRGTFWCSVRIDANDSTHRCSTDPAFLRKAWALSTVRDRPRKMFEKC